jgi:transcriptional regulator with PAS, ATPase and Fis domain/CheY-like chemotaxis protein
MSIVPMPVCDPVLGVLIVSPNGELRRELMSRVKSERWRLMEAVSGAHAFGQLEAEEFRLLLLDPSLPDLNSNEFQKMVRAQFPDLQILPLDRQTGLPLPSTTREQLGNELAGLLGTDMVITHTPEMISHEPLNKAVSPLPGMIGSSASMQRVYRMTQLVARRDTTVLVLGESGTGKDLVAQAIHNLSPRRANPFVVINCAAIPEALLEAELFGYTKGAFTGAVQSRIGRIHAAQGGTLFLDEIGDLPLGLQSKLLRFLEQGEVQRLGSTDSFKVDVRVVAATNGNLRKLVQEKQFREDLYYRLAIFPIELPLMKDRMEDLPTLASSFLSRFSSNRMSLGPEATFQLLQHSWPGNVRELRNVIERATILAEDERQLLARHIVI